MGLSLLEQVNSAADAKKLSFSQCEKLSGEIRQYIIDTVSDTGGHLASNLGVVELTLALFRVFDPPEDRIIWDVGHQSYTHKILSGRREALKTIRQLGGLSGFPRTSESPCDAFDTGHSSTSVSAGLGIAKARDLKKESYHVISVIGDGALTGGMAMEALNNASGMKTNFIIVLNDNSMSISRNVGGMSDYLNRIRTAKGYTTLKKKVETGLGSLPVVGDGLVRRVKLTKDSLKKLVIPGMLFEDMGITYLGPVDGHNQRALEAALRGAARMDHAVLVHVVTKKGKGYEPAEKQPWKYHGVDPFEPATGKCFRGFSGKTCTDVFSEELVTLAEKDPRIVAITAAMPDGTGLARFREQFPERFFDVGIAEGHAVTFAAGLASAGMHPVVAVYSSFLQRGFDQIVHDVGLKKLPVVFAVDRAGLVGADGETHQGIFDLSYFSMIPGMTVMAPGNAGELREMLRFAFSLEGPAAIRYPRGEAREDPGRTVSPVRPGKAELLHRGRKTALFALGSMVSTAEQVMERLREDGEDPTLINARFAKPFDREMILSLTEDHDLIVVLEENVACGGLGASVCTMLGREAPGIKVLGISLPDSYIEHGDVTHLKKLLGMDPDSIADRIREYRNGDERKEKTGCPAV